MLHTLRGVCLVCDCFFWRALLLFLRLSEALPESQTDLDASRCALPATLLSPHIFDRATHRLALAFYNLGIFDLLGVLDDGTVPAQWERDRWVEWLWAQQTRTWPEHLPPTADTLAHLERFWYPLGSLCDSDDVQTEIMVQGFGLAHSWLSIHSKLLYVIVVC